MKFVYVPNPRWPQSVQQDALRKVAENASAKRPKPDSIDAVVAMVFMVVACVVWGVTTHGNAPIKTLGYFVAAACVSVAFVWLLPGSLKLYILQLLRIVYRVPDIVVDAMKKAAETMSLPSDIEYSPHFYHELRRVTRQCRSDIVTIDRTERLIAQGTTVIFDPYQQHAAINNAAWEAVVRLRNKL